LIIKTSLKKDLASIRSQAKKFSNQSDIQCGQHSSEIDAQATMALFHKYRDMKIETTLDPKVNLQEEFDGIQTLKTNYKQLAAEFFRKK
jgi:hypothetical protein